jgi:hypothetical protein
MSKFPGKNADSTGAPTRQASVILSARALARELGRSGTAVCGWLRRGDWPFGGPPWHRRLLPAIRRWARRTLAPDRAAAARAAARATEADIRSLRAEAQRLLADLAKEAQ